MHRLAEHGERLGTYLRFRFPVADFLTNKLNIAIGIWRLKLKFRNWSTYNEKVHDCTTVGDTFSN